MVHLLPAQSPASELTVSTFTAPDERGLRSLDPLAHGLAYRLDDSLLVLCTQEATFQTLVRASPGQTVGWISSETDSVEIAYLGNSQFYVTNGLPEQSFPVDMRYRGNYPTRHVPDQAIYYQGRFHQLMVSIADDAINDTFLLARFPSLTSEPTVMHALGNFRPFPGDTIRALTYLETDGSQLLYANGADFQWFSRASTVDSGHRPIESSYLGIRYDIYPLTNYTYFLPLEEVATVRPRRLAPGSETPERFISGIGFQGYYQAGPDSILVHFGSSLLKIDEPTQWRETILRADMLGQRTLSAGPYHFFVATDPAVTFVLHQTSNRIDTLPFRITAANTFVAANGEPRTLLQAGASGELFEWTGTEARPIALPETFTGFPPFDVDTDGHYPTIACVKDGRYFFIGQTDVGRVVFTIPLPPGNGKPTERCSPTTAISRILPAELRVYPNPTSGILFIDYAAGTELQGTLYNGRGRRMQSFTMRRSHRLNVEALPAGMYFLRLVDSASGAGSLRPVLIQ